MREVMTEPIIIFAKITPKSQFYKDVEDTLLRVIPIALKEAGCLALKLYRGKEDGLIYIYEVWKDDEARAFHSAQSYTKEVLRNFQTWLSEPMEVLNLTRMI
jgi:quinol monooxygenase YgiN